MRLIYHPDAEAELVEAARYYEQRSPGLGTRFVRELEAAVLQIHEAPLRWPVIESDVRRFLMRRFPYGIYYRSTQDELRILVIKHHSRHPDYWKRRLRD